MAFKTLGKFYTDITPAVAVGAGAKIQLQNSVTCNPCLALVNNEDIQIKAKGVYDVKVNVTYEATAVGDVAVDLQANGADVAGASGSASMVAIGDFATISYSTVLTVNQGASGSFATLSLNNINASSIVVANVVIEKIA